MKKHLLLSGVLLLAASLTSQAETVAFSIVDGDDALTEVCKGYEAELTVNDDGSITIDNFFQTGSPITFTIGEVGDNGYAPITVVSENTTDSYYVFPKNAEGKYLTAHLTPLDSNDGFDIYSVYLYTDPSYCYASHDETKGTTSCGLYISGYLDEEENSENYADSYELDFTFGGGDAAIIKPEIDNANAPVEYFNMQGIKIANPDNGLYIRRQGSDVSKIMVR